MMKLMRRIPISGGAHRIRTLAAFLAIGVFAAPFALAQSQPGAPPQPSFEAATIKPTAHPDPSQGYWSLPGIGRFSAHCVSVQFLVQMGFDVEANQISGKPSWLDSDFYDVEAKPE